MIVVRRAVPADAEAAATCQTRCWRETYAGLVPDAYLDAVGVQQRLPRWAARIAGGRDVWVAQDGAGEIVGVGSAGRSRDDPPVRERELMSLYTRAVTHGNGLGTRLLTALIGSTPASLWVFEGNARAIAFYGRHGFAPDGARAFDDGTGLAELRMVR